jgi:hypothetical protein
LTPRTSTPIGWGALARTQRDLELVSEAFALWVKLLFAHTPTIPEDARRAARMTAQDRYRGFVHTSAAVLGRQAIPRRSAAGNP